MNFLKTMLALQNVMGKGQAVADPVNWKRGQISATALGAFLIALLQLSKALGWDVPVDEDTATAFAGAVVAIVNMWLTIATTRKLGVPGMDSQSPDEQKPG